jgi:polyphosphate kinase
MPRNIDRRVEVLFPIEDAAMRQEVVDRILGIYLKDTANARLLESDGRYIPRIQQLKEGDVPFNAQQWFLNGRSLNGKVTPVDIKNVKQPTP